MCNAAHGCVHRNIPRTMNGTYRSEKRIRLWVFWSRDNCRHKKSRTHTQPLTQTASSVVFKVGGEVEGGGELRARLKLRSQTTAAHLQHILGLSSLAGAAAAAGAAVGSGHTSAVFDMARKGKEMWLTPVGQRSLAMAPIRNIGGQFGPVFYNRWRQSFVSH
jgi:hypothetical protein